MTEPVLLLADIQPAPLRTLLERYRMLLQIVTEADAIPGSYWGDSEAGLIGNRLYARPDTPVHSILHESCHYICMDPQRRAQLDTDAEGDYDEENAVCYLQILLSKEIPDMGRERILQDMDAWGYTFRLGSARAWFHEDAEDARQWLLKHALIDPRSNPTFQIRTSP